MDQSYLLLLAALPVGYFIYSKLRQSKQTTAQNDESVSAVENLAPQQEESATLAVDTALNAPILL
ncbi:TPA: hypothetical protein I7693_20825, partial [Vibrio vulnificus]|nr:hypothetical protein [Vibrio vulnificus]HAS8210061.1 hypothetical protein [Vibrio vulnificus]HAS8432982.1 hypothetical protein [Vibrio vulnificus]